MARRQLLAPLAESAARRTERGAWGAGARGAQGLRVGLKPCKPTQPVPVLYASDLYSICPFALIF